MWQHVIWSLLEPCKRKLRQKKKAGTDGNMDSLEGKSVMDFPITEINETHPLRTHPFRHGSFRKALVETFNK